MILAPDWPWNLRGYRLFLDDVARVWAILDTGRRASDRKLDRLQPGTLAYLTALMEELREPVLPAASRVILVYENDQGGDAQTLDDVARDDVVAFTLAGPGVVLHVHRRDETGFIEWDDRDLGYEVLRALEPRRLRDWWLVAWKPYRVRFIPTTRADHQQKVRHRWAVAGVIGTFLGVAVALLTLI